MRLPLNSVLLGTLLCSLCVGTEDGSAARPGTFGQVAPQSGDVRLSDAVPHQDDHGGTLQQLVCAAGSPSGFALLWRDHREGMMGLYLGRFDREGRILEPERPIHHPYAGRRLQPALAVDPRGGGISLWTADSLNLPVLFAHTYDAQSQWQGGDQALTELPTQMHDASERKRGVELPTAAPLEKGGFAVAWTQRGAVLWTSLKPDGSKGDSIARLNPKDQEADPGVQLSGSGNQAPLAIWHADGRLWSLSLRNPRATAHDLGAGTLIRAVARADGGAWLLVSGPEGSTARRLRADGNPEGKPLAACGAGEQALDLALIGDDLALLVQTQGAKRGETPGRGRGGRTQSASGDASFQLRLFDAAHGGDARAIEFLSAEAKPSGTPLVVSDGRRLLVAWTDSREGDPDVFARLVDPAAAEPLRPEFRANTDRASADQSNYRLASSASEALVTWSDKRDGVPQAYARRIQAPGSFEGGEFLLPGQDAQAGSGPVAPALQPDGVCGFAWSDSAGALHFAAVDRGAKLIAEARVLQPSGARDCALLALPSGQGWLCAWAGSEPGVWMKRIDLGGVPSGERQQLSRASSVPMNNVELCFLGGRRVVAAWDQDDGGWKIRGRFAGLDGVPSGDVFELDGSPRHQDWDPALAPTGKGGFVVSWTSGASDDRTRDVVARFFDGDAHAEGPLLWISPTVNEQDFSDIVRLADGTWAVAWEDDISGLDDTYARRIQKDQRQLGPIVRLNLLQTKSIEDRCAPRVVALADGLVSAFGDRSRSLGWDVRVRVLGPRFDVPEKP
ncbi:MAG: hypothetical protein IPJ19_08525 [Planctomycetes bacterium]|nr:hypothetical protein [Planctomycetota bacterium]